MICRQCGTEIADKAIVCYRCGAGTAEPLRKPADVRPRRSRVVPLVVVVILAVLAWLLGEHYHVFGHLFGLEHYDPPTVELLIDWPAIHA